MDRKFIVIALGYAVVGMALGVYMGASQNHSEFVTHAHIMLLGFVVSFIYGLCHKLWLNNKTSGLAIAQFYVHQAATLVLVVGLFLLYGRFIEEAAIGPFLGVASTTALIGMILMFVLFLKTGRTQG
ncbi:MAG: hypothetical protein ACLQHK_12945 [Gallionellaceae bacterium]